MIFRCKEKCFYRNRLWLKGETLSAAKPDAMLTKRFNVVPDPTAKETEAAAQVAANLKAASQTADKILVEEAKTFSEMAKAKAAEQESSGQQAVASMSPNVFQ